MRKNISERNEEKIASTYFALKRNNKFWTKQSNKNTEAKRSEKEQYGNKKRSKKKNTEVKRKYGSEWREKKNLGSEKKQKNRYEICLNMRNRSKTNPVSLRFALKRKKFEAKQAHPKDTS